MDKSEFNLAPPQAEREAPFLLLNDRQAAAALSIGVRTVWNLVEAGELRTVRIGRSVRFPVAELKAWIERKVQEQIKEQANGQSHQ